ncbi:C40 family peptidase [Paenibacillus hodogayensis]|uniref:C40 family peptidase n=1 Tax=Paenibacillus hodogayensis TaxID=279208 RepID=A0ABV5VY25_9BACL
MKFTHLTKTLAVVGMSLTLFFSGSLFLASGSTQAASVTASSSSVANRIINTGKQFMGVPYKFGAKTGNTSSFDCSSFTQYIFKQNGVSIPRSSKQQSKVGTFVPRSQLQPGDLVFFYSPIHHVAVYIGNGKIMHTYGKPGVTISDLNSGSWSKRYATARRVL